MEEDRRRSWKQSKRSLTEKGSQKYTGMGNGDRKGMKEGRKKESIECKLDSVFESE